MQNVPPLGLACFLSIATACVSLPVLAAQQPEAQPTQPIGRTAAAEVQVSGAVELRHGEMLLGNGSTITAADQTVTVALSRGGKLRLCSTTSLHLAKDSSISDPQNTALMMALDRGALETEYAVGKYSDVLLTPDLRILISGPGDANLSVRVNTQGDTCVDNHGANAPYVTVSSQLEGGVYRVLPNQRVTFEHGSLTEVVDHETAPCGCPTTPVVSLASAGNPSKNPSHPGQPVGGPSSTPADTAFPIAESEGLAAPPAPSAKPVVPIGQPHAQVTVPLTYNGENPPPIPPPVAQQNGGTASAGALATPAPAETTAPRTVSSGSASQETAQTALAPTTSEKNRQGGFFHRMGHFFSRIFRPGS